MKPFYVHINPYKPGKMSSRHPRGATLYVSDAPGRPNEVMMQVSFCSPKDSFCKAIGRTEAKLREVEYVNKRDVPFMVGAADLIVQGVQATTEENIRRHSHKYDYLLKNFI